MSSQIKTGLLLGLLTAIVLLIGQAVGGRGGLMLAFLFAIVMNVGSYWFSDKIVLSMYRARELAPEDAPMLHAMVDELAAEARIPKPRLYVVPQESPNAFATGRNPDHAAVAVTEGIMHLLSPEELRGVIAHELAHVKNRDILVQTVASVMAGVIVMLANWVKWTAIFGFGRGSDEEGGGNPLAALAMAIVAPIAATIIQFAISRSREYLADETGARISRSPLSLAGALEKLSRGSERVPLHGNQATENMFIVNPFSGRSMMSLFSTHPPIEERVARLRQMAGAR
jgi:heat shock protein HtpX